MRNSSVMFVGSLSVNIYFYPSLLPEMEHESFGFHVLMVIIELIA